VPQVKIVRC